MTSRTGQIQRGVRTRATSSWVRRLGRSPRRRAEGPTGPSPGRPQPQELWAGPAQSILPVVVAGDFNAPADGSAAGAAYSDFVDSSTGFVDAWKARHRRAPDTPGDRNRTHIIRKVQLTERIDFIFVHGDARVLQSRGRIQPARPQARTPLAVRPRSRDLSCGFKPNGEGPRRPMPC